MLEYKIVPYNNSASTSFEVDINKFADEGWKFEAVLTRGQYTSIDNDEVCTADLLFSRETKTIAEVINDAMYSPVGDPRGA